MSTTNGNGNGAVEEVIERMEAYAFEPSWRLHPSMSLTDQLERRAARLEELRSRDETSMGEEGEC